MANHINPKQQQIISQIINRYSNLECIACATAIKTYLISQNIQGKLIKIKTGAEIDFRNSFLYDDSIPNDAISETGYHEGVSVIRDGIEIVFDNNHPEGLSQEQWLSNFQFFGKVHLGQALIVTEEPF